MQRPRNRRVVAVERHTNVDLGAASQSNVGRERGEARMMIDNRVGREEALGHRPTDVSRVSTGEGTSEGDVFASSSLGSGTSFFDDTTTRDMVAVQFTLPLFAGGGTSSRVREAVYLHRASREQLQRVTRETERQARDAYLRMLSAGGSKYPIDLLKDAGVDMTTSEPFKAAMREMNHVMDEIEKILDRGGAKKSGS